MSDNLCQFYQKVLDVENTIVSGGKNNKNEKYEGFGMSMTI